MTQELKDAQRDLNYTSILSSRWYISGEEGLRTYGSGLEFRKLDSFLAYPEPHRIDIIATLRSQRNPPLVRIFEEKRALSIVCIADLTRSMNSGTPHTRIQDIAKIITALSYSASVNGDICGFFGYESATVIKESPITKDKGLKLGNRLWNFVPQDGDSHEGLLRIIPHLPQIPSLIILISDFLFEIKTLRKFLQKTNNHDVIAIVMRHPIKAMPSWGISYIKDSESKKKKIRILTPWHKNALRKQYEKYIHERLSLFKSLHREFLDVVSEFSFSVLKRFFAKRRY
ncbi:MAG: hypothetical protein A3A04_00305 [Candidatus Harrisonbacteria bacterium RIFCSPLOWO2_01_FULL_40_28]|uniref:DUF58 domain-containing protein n=2 Tax=Candidatus Harrisoniibacteriota TaxID=1817905 RepID=A0A1G1ZYM4_9BACT|nr:MAG: hypothetical protein A3A04_00305 [Candidatus Harrisonbacteria bacterium RIFCSPLOWO2_01_FULL_40_28]OGY68860.1 MAG: hypothetical protein A2586_02400 [Candidatus Harrisonbacteria bacterium RIFOXYD1_FULL_40_9]